MSTRTQLNTSNDTKIRNNVALIDQDTDHATFNAELIDEMFPTTTNVVLSTGNLQYNLNFTKSGNICVLQGFIKNNGSTIVNGVNFYTVSTAIYQAKHVQLFNGVREGSTSVINLRLGSSASSFANELRLQTALAVGAVVNFSLTYITND